MYPCPSQLYYLFAKSFEYVRYIEHTQKLKYLEKIKDLVSKILLRKRKRRLRFRYDLYYRRTLFTDTCRD